MATDRAVVTVMGRDRVGIVAGISGELAEANANIVDLASTKMGDLFVMTILIDISGMRGSLAELKERLRRRGEALGVQVMVQHEDVFRYMHRV
ncbi:MAG: ACT domain-containing protein [Candidatus Bathyarchaeia archaeon]